MKRRTFTKISGTSILLPSLNIQNNLFVLFGNNIALGYVAKQRPAVDNAQHITFIMELSRKFMTDAIITGWNMYARCQVVSCNIYLQLWRPLSGGSYQLIGQTYVAVSNQERLYTITLEASQYIPAKAGDVLGLQYDRGAVMFSHVVMSNNNPLCPNNNDVRLRYRANLPSSIPLGNVYDITTFVQPWCKMYAYNPIYNAL